MKKSIVMALVVLAILAGPVFAGEVSTHVWLGTAISTDLSAGDNSQAVVDSSYGFSGAVDDFTSLALNFATDARIDVSKAANEGLKAVNYKVDNVIATTNVLGALGVVDSPVTLNLAYGYGRLDSHSRWSKITGWDYDPSGRKDYASATQWTRSIYLDAQVNIMDFVGVRFGMNPEFGSGDTGILAEAWTTIPAGPASINVDLTFARDTGASVYFIGGRVDASMAFGPVSLRVQLDENYVLGFGATTGTNYLQAGVSAGFTFGPASFGVTASYALIYSTYATSQVLVDGYFNIAMFSIYGGYMMSYYTTLSYSYEFGAGLNLGAANITVGINGGTAGKDIRAFDNILGNGTSNPDLFIQFSCGM